MVLICARFRDHSDIGAGGAPKSRAILSSLNFEFSYRVGIGNGNSTACRACTQHIADANPVLLPIVVIGARPMYVEAIIGGIDLRERGPTHSQFPGIVDAGRHPCR